MNYRLFQIDDVHSFRSGDARPNTGLREGDIPHAEVNEVLRSCEKSVIFGQQTRLRDGIYLADKRLNRLHAGHDLVKFFYGAVRQLPSYLVDALLDQNVSVTLVHGPDLLVFHHPREHQSFHTGRSRRTIYVPEAVLQQAFELGYDYWAIGEMIVQEAWPLLDYLLILEFVRRCQQHLKTHYTLGYHFIHDRLHELNSHLCGILARLDRHPLYHTVLLDQYREITGDREVVLKENIQPEVERLSWFVPEDAYNHSSDPQGVRPRMSRFEELRRHDPDAKGLFDLLAAVFVRLDRAENRDDLLVHVRGIGEYAVDELQAIVDDVEQFNDEIRPAIRNAARDLLAELPDADPADSAEVGHRSLREATPAPTRSQRSPEGNGATRAVPRGA